MTFHGYDVARAFLEPHGPQECACGEWEPNLEAMKRHLLFPEGRPVRVWMEQPERPPEPVRWPCRLCDAPAKALGLCNAHYARRWRMEHAA